MSFRPKSSKVAHLTMDEVRKIVQAKEESMSVNEVGDEQLVKELQNRGFRVNRDVT